MMEADTILTFQAPTREGSRVTAHPSPVLELAYALYYLLKRLQDGRAKPHDAAWVAQLVAERADLVEALRAFGPRHAVDDLGVPLLVLAARYGYDRDEAPERYLRDLPSLPQRFLDDGWSPPRVEEADDDASSRQEAAFRDTVARLAGGDVATELRTLLERFWQALERAWREEGREVTSRAAAEFQNAFDRTGAVLEALPAHHFTRFEHLAHGIQEAQTSGRVVVVPLYFASAGGFNFVTAEGHFVGYGLQSQHAFERTAQVVEALAGRTKALADPNRLMVLALVGRFAAMRLTVGDLASEIGVSQPTLSGHLKLLREAGLVVAERHGTKSYYRLERDGLRGLLHELEAALLD
jgi:ArsR family transcriptional regulator, arsenate/arsenite/antimonite-responsive transcriptional repressor